MRIVIRRKFNLNLKSNKVFSRNLVKEWGEEWKWEDRKDIASTFELITLEIILSQLYVQLCAFEIPSPSVVFLEKNECFHDCEDSSVDNVYQKIVAAQEQKKWWLYTLDRRTTLLM